MVSITTMRRNFPLHPFWVALHLFMLIVAPARAQTDAANDFATAIAPLSEASYADKADIVKRVAELRAPGSKEFLQAFLEGNIYARIADKKVFIAAEQDNKLTLTDPITQQAAGTEDGTGFEKIGTNNGLRKSLRGAIAQFDLTDPEAAVRLAAVKDLLRMPDETTKVHRPRRLKQRFARDTTARDRHALSQLESRCLQSTQANGRASCRRFLLRTR
ncbi:MAG TPA: hypothetical protein VK629_17980 [Steroidobacteraceae bacterium]|nr:hypothetical protein [Steroidobacteraceae bacterium]